MNTFTTDFVCTATRPMPALVGVSAGAWQGFAGSTGLAGSTGVAGRGVQGFGAIYGSTGPAIAKRCAGRTRPGAEPTTGNGRLSQQLGRSLT